MKGKETDHFVEGFVVFVGEVRPTRSFTEIFENNFPANSKIVNHNKNWSHLCPADLYSTIY